MKLRHAAALAMVGWYLMAPPLAATQKEWESFVNLPIGQWDIRQSFDSAEKCEVVRQQNSDRAFHAGNPVPLSFRPDMMAVCVSTDDPRLKGN